MSLTYEKYKQTSLLIIAKYTLELGYRGNIVQNDSYNQTNYEIASIDCLLIFLQPPTGINIYHS